MNGRKNYFFFVFHIKSFLFKRPELVQIMRSIGNKLANSVWEANIKNRVKPQPNASSYIFFISYLIKIFLFLFLKI